MTTDLDEVAVYADQRALVDKILARYSSEFTLFRELLQNADDAGSHNAEIRFETEARCQERVVHWTLKNDGKVFEDNDWMRLRQIAAGNPDPDKIGAFGVGFYSVFSVTDKPCVTSGGVETRFYWKDNDNQLYASCRDLPQKDHWTTFKIPLREPRPMLSILDLMRFLVSSITFALNLTTVDIFLDDVCIGHIKKSPQCSRTVNLPKDIEWSSYNRIMRMKEIQSHRIVIETKFTNSRALSSVETLEFQLGLTIFTVDVEVKADEKLLQELYRCMKKGLPSQLKYSLIYTGKDDYDRNSLKLQNYHPDMKYIFRGLVDFEGAKYSRIFIGHATGQTTSIGGHMASRFIPTVERESIDFVDPYVSVWNIELLRIGGFLCRVVHELELSDIKRLWEGVDAGAPSEGLAKSRDDFHQRFLHVLRFFTFHESTPSPKVAQILRESFYGSTTSPVRLLSSIGVCKATEIRASDPPVARFTNAIPMLSDEAARIINSQPGQCEISPVSVQEVLQALDGHPLSETKLIHCLQWWLELRHSDSSPRATDLLHAVSFCSEGQTSLSLSRMEYFINTNGLGSHIPHDGPLPASLIPLTVSRKFTSANLMELGWREFTVIDWFQYISRADITSRHPAQDIIQSADWAERVLYTLSRAWSSFTEQQCSEVKHILEKNTCIPTGDGLRCPSDSYLPVANLSLLSEFGLTVVALSRFDVDNEMRTLLLYVGVQTHVPLELLFDRLLETREWTAYELASYLGRSSSLTTQQICALSSSKRFFKERSQDTIGDESRYYVNDLYPPIDIFRRLDLPVIDWKKGLKWLDTSAEAKLLYQIGLNRHPPLEKIIGLCASPNAPRENAFTFFCKNLPSVYAKYESNDFQDVAFVPAENKGEPCWKSPKDVFLGRRWKVLGLAVVRSGYEKMITSELGVRLGIRQNPTPPELLSLLKISPPCYEEAGEWYECLSEHIQVFTQSDLDQAGKLNIVPKTSSNSREWLVPTECYLGRPANEFLSNLFVFVHFGTKAKQFLSACGAKEEPSVKDVAEKLVQDPQWFYNLAGSPKSFLQKLRDLATQEAYIPNDTLHRMSRKPTLLGERRQRVNGREVCEIVYDLRQPEEIVIVDDPRDYELFGDVAYVAPREELLQTFYSSLGCRRLSSVIHERYETSSAVKDTETCDKIRKLVLERLDSFLKKYSHYQYDQERDLRSKKFSVGFCERLRVQKTLNIGNKKTTQSQDLWAVTKSADDGSMELWLSKHGKQDMYDLAASLFRLLFGVVKDTDIFLLAATFSSDVELLKRAGFDVDQSCQQNPSELLADVPARDDESVVDHPHILVNRPDDDKPSEPKPSCSLKDVPARNDEVTNSAPRSASVAIDGDSGPATKDPHPQSTFEYVAFAISDTVNNVCDAYRKAKGNLSPNPPSKSAQSKCKSIARPSIQQDYIRDTVARASKRYSPGSSRPLDDKDAVVQFLRHNSCSDFAHVNNLWPIGITPQGIHIHVAGGEPDVCAFIAGKQELLARFVCIIVPAASAHQLLMEWLHVFYDVNGGPIAFNLEGSIYLNLRYFEQWHDEDVRSGRLRRAQRSWFFVLAHEIAHNLIPLHDAAHAFWFSAICDDHMDDFLASMVPDA